MTVRQSQTLVRVASLIGGLLLLLISATFGRAEESKRPVAAGVVAPLATKLEMLMQEQRQRDLHNLTVRIGAARGEEAALRELAYGEGPAWAQTIFASMPGISPLCELYYRWKAADWVLEYYTFPAAYQLVQLEDISLSSQYLHALRYGAGIAYAQALLQELANPARIRRGCTLISPETIARELVRVLDAIGVTPAAINTTPKKIAALVRAAR